MIQRDVRNNVSHGIRPFNSQNSKSGLALPFMRFKTSALDHNKGRAKLLSLQLNY